MKRDVSVDFSVKHASPVFIGDYPGRSVHMERMVKREEQNYSADSSTRLAPQGI